MKRNLFILLTALLALALPTWAQGTKSKEPLGATGNAAGSTEKKKPGNLTVSISSVVKEDANAKVSGEGRLIPVRFQWLCGSEGNARLVTLEAKLITLNTDGKQTVVTKRLVDWTVNKPITSVIDLPMANDVFAKNFTLELVGKFHDGVVERAVSTIKQGNFPLPSLVGKKR